METIECRADNTDTCDDLPSWQCYDDRIRKDCCHMCNDNRVKPSIPSCEFGDKIENCDADNGIRCYNITFLQNCCQTCRSYETFKPGCRFGDKVSSCDKKQCSRYTNQRRLDCCLTCVNLAAPITFPPIITTDGTTTEGTTALGTTLSQPDAGVPVWVVPVAASVGGLVVLIVLIVVIVLLRRNHKSTKRLSVIDEKMYNEYKMSKRAPMAPPRTPETKRHTILERKDSAEYAYINPDHVEVPDLNRRSGNDPLPLTPGEYLDLTQADVKCDDKYTYPSDVNNISHSYGNNLPTNDHAGVKKSNTYGKFPESRTYINEQGY